MRLNKVLYTTAKLSNFHSIDVGTFLGMLLALRGFGYLPIHLQTSIVFHRHSYFTSCNPSLKVSVYNSCINSDKHPVNYVSLFYASEVISSAYFVWVLARYALTLDSIFAYQKLHQISVLLAQFDVLFLNALYQ